MITRFRYTVEVHDEAMQNGKRFFGRIVNKTFDDPQDAKDFATRLVENDIPIERITIRHVRTTTDVLGLIVVDGNMDFA